MRSFLLFLMRDKYFKFFIIEEIQVFIDRSIDRSFVCLFVSARKCKENRRKRGRENQFDDSFEINKSNKLIKICS